MRATATHATGDGRRRCASSAMSSVPIRFLVAFAPAAVSADKVQGGIPSPFAPPSGCAFHPRCPIVIDKCRAPPGPELRPLAEAHEVSCWRAS